jgi:capsule polysaccharide export protein KpsC/LpsZ
VHKFFPGGIPENILLISADAEINTYDLIEIADLGLVYTTTVGMEMAMSGVPVIVIGQTHYRDKGFTLDPQTWDAFFELLTDLLSSTDITRLTRREVDLAREYAYRFFFEYPQPYPWHLLHMWEDIDNVTMETVLGESGMKEYGETFQYLAGKPIDWSR